MKKERLFVTTEGTGPNLVLLHGWGVHSAIWKFVVEKLAHHFCVYLIDLPGFGRSNVNIPDYSLNTVINQVLAVAPSRAIWLGWSLGGLIATQIAISHPQRIEKLVTVASSPKFTREENWPGISEIILDQFAQQLNENYESTLMRFLTLQFYGETESKKMLRWLQKNLFVYGKPKLEILYSALKLLKSLDLRDHLSQILCPILALFGGLDTMVPKETARAMHSLHPLIECHVFPKASHALFLSHQEEFFKQIALFLL